MLRLRLQLLTGVAAMRLKDRLDILDAFKRATALLPIGWADQYLSTGEQSCSSIWTWQVSRGQCQHPKHTHYPACAGKGVNKELPAWWSPVDDEALMMGVLHHGFGNWLEIFEVRWSWHSWFAATHCDVCEAGMSDG